MRMTVFRIISVLAVAVIFSILIGVVFAFVQPHFFPGPYGPYLAPVLGLGVLMAALIGGYVGYRDPAADAVRGKVRIDLRFAVVVGALTLYLSMLFILNTRGS